MKKKKLLAAVLLAAIAIAVVMALCFTQANTVGVIGGADGPTAIFITTIWEPWLLLPLAAVAAACVYFYRKKK